MKKNIVWGGAVVCLLTTACASMESNPLSPSPSTTSNATIPVAQAVTAPTPSPSPTPAPVVSNPPSNSGLDCSNPRNHFLTNLSEDGKSIQVRNDWDCEISFVFVGFNIPMISTPQGQNLVEIIEYKLPAHSVWANLTFTKNLGACYQTDFFYQMTRDDVNSGRVNGYPPYASKLVLNHGQAPIGCDPPIVIIEPQCPPGTIPTLREGEPYCGPILPPIDVCVNIPGAQLTIPDGMILDDQFNCVIPPPDPCKKAHDYKVGKYFAPAPPIDPCEHHED